MKLLKDDAPELIRPSVPGKNLDPLTPTTAASFDPRATSQGFATSQGYATSSRNSTPFVANLNSPVNPSSRYAPDPFLTPSQPGKKENNFILFYTFFYCQPSKCYTIIQCKYNSMITIQHVNPLSFSPIRFKQE